MGHGSVDAKTNIGSAAGGGTTSESAIQSGVTQVGDYNLRKKYVALADSVKAHGGEVYVFSSMHVSGQQLDNFTGCAAILRFPLADPDDVFEEEEGGEEGVFEFAEKEKEEEEEE